ncbi:MAG: hypothetical protein LC437_07665 [Thiohalomonas sp.]|nr:hypothetical protein [Thiohalomonas sp.]
MMQAFEWTLQYPEQTVLLDKSPVEKSRIISKEDFQSHQLSPKEFEQQSLTDDSMIYDVRDREQCRGGSGLYPINLKMQDRALGNYH